MRASAQALTLLCYLGTDVSEGGGGVGGKGWCVCN